MTPRTSALRLYGRPSQVAPLEWDWAVERLRAAGTYWVVGHGGQPHPRPVWGVWAPDDRLHLSIGSPALRAAVRPGEPVTVHLDSGTDVVIVEGVAAAAGPTAAATIELYNAKYDWDYRVAEYGEFTAVRPRTVLAWRSAGWAGREGFRQTGRWDLDPPPQRPARPLSRG
jgi:hypothetical protein